MAREKRGHLGNKIIILKRTDRKWESGKYPLSLKLRLAKGQKFGEVGRLPEAPVMVRMTNPDTSFFSRGDSLLFFELPAALEAREYSRRRRRPKTGTCFLSERGKAKAESGGRSGEGLVMRLEL